MQQSTPEAWEPDRQKMGNWRAMFEQDRHVAAAGSSPATPDDLPREPLLDDAPSIDASTYKPWILQRGRSRPAMMLEFRRFEPRSGLWTGWAIAYPHLVALDYTGDKLLSLDFGTRHFVLEGDGLDVLARHIQQGDVVAIQEYAPSLWQIPAGEPAVTLIRRLELPA